MDYMMLGEHLPSVSRLAIGCMRLGHKTAQEVATILSVAQEVEINFYDHADVYASGDSERQFAQGRNLARIPREKLILQSKCGLQDVQTDYHFDSSKKQILTSLEGSLQRLQTDYLDVLLLHRPDTLIEPEEVAEAFYQLQKEGKVRFFGVSNFNPSQIELLQSYLSQPLIVNQLEFGPAHTLMVDAGLNVNSKNPLGIVYDGGVLDYCRLKKITVQAWSPFQIDLKQGTFMEHSAYQELTETLGQLAVEKQVSIEAVTLAWILRHPAMIQPIIGTTNPKRLEKMVLAGDVSLSRKEWYRIYKSAGNPLP